MTNENVCPSKNLYRNVQEHYSWWPKSGKNSDVHLLINGSIKWWVDYDLAIKNVLIRAMTWMNLKNRLSEWSPSQKVMCCVISFIWTVQNWHIHRGRKYISGCQRVFKSGDNSLFFIMVHHCSPFLHIVFPASFLSRFLETAYTIYAFMKGRMKT